MTNTWRSRDGTIHRIGEAALEPVSDVDVAAAAKAVQQQGATVRALKEEQHLTNKDK